MKIVYLAGLFTVLLGSSAAVLAEPQLYETGPSEVSSYVRFVNATDAALEITAAKGAKIALSAAADGRASRFFTVKSGVKLTANVLSNGRKTTVEVSGKPWEYITVAILPGDAAKLKTQLVRETPDDFNAMRASVSLFNLDASCAAATLQGGAKSATILEGVKPYAVQRRLINPVKLSASARCGDAPAEVDLGQLEAGGRYSVFLMNLKKTRQAWFVRDAN